MEKRVQRKRSVSEPTEFFETSREGKKGGGFASFLHKLPFLSGKLQQNSSHGDRSSPSDDEFCDLEEEMKKAAKEANKRKSHKKSHKSDDHKVKEGNVGLLGSGEVGTYQKLRGSCDVVNFDLPLSPSVTIKGLDLAQPTPTPSKVNIDAVERCGSDSKNDLELVSGPISGDNQDVNDERPEEKSNRNEPEDLHTEHSRMPIEVEEPPHHEPPPTPLPPPQKSCLKNKNWVRGKTTDPFRPQRRRSLSVPEGDPYIVFRLNRHVRFSPGTVDPIPRNCRYREWIERHCSHKNVASSVNLRHEKRMQKLKQIHSLDINKYLSKNNQNYHSVMLSPMRSLGCDIFM